MALESLCLGQNGVKLWKGEFFLSIGTGNFSPISLYPGDSKDVTK